MLDSTERQESKETNHLKSLLSHWLSSGCFCCSFPIFPLLSPNLFLVSLLLYFSLLLPLSFPFLFSFTKCLSAHLSYTAFSHFMCSLGFFMQNHFHPWRNRASKYGALSVLRELINFTNGKPESLSVLPGCSVGSLSIQAVHHACAAADSLLGLFSILRNLFFPLISFSRSFTQVRNQPASAPSAESSEGAARKAAAELWECI